MLSPILIVEAGNSLHEIDMQVVLIEDGSAQITETWSLDISEGTEIYKEMQDMGESSIRDFTVTQGDKIFETLENWDVNASREEKAGKAGILKTGNNYELCFGVGEYGENTYTMHYTIDKFVAKYQDMYGMNWRLVNKDIEMKPATVKIDISGHGITDNTRMYAFGFEGNINPTHNEGVPHIIAINKMEDGSVGRVNYVNILLGLEGATFSNGITIYSDRTFGDIFEEASEGSSYTKENRNASSGWVVTSGESGHFFFIMAVLMPAGIFTLVILMLSKKQTSIEYTDGITEKTHRLDVDYFRDIPCNQNIYSFYYLLLKTRLVAEKEVRSGLLTAVLLDWIRNEHVEFVKEEKKTIFSTKDVFKIYFKVSPDFNDILGNKLYGYFKEAAGSNGILENKEFEKWCIKHYKRLDAWFDDVEVQMKAKWAAEGYTQTVRTTQRFLGIFKVPTGKLLYTPKFREEVHHSVGFKKFLLEFGSLGDKETREVFLWECYLIFASILGIADKVEKEIGRLYPEFQERSYLDTTYTTMATRAFVYRGMSRAIAAQTASSSSGIGGSSSFGGGGSSFSGGGGGGVR